MNNTVANINATANSCYHFVNWTGDTGNITNVNNANTTISMVNDSTAIANFAINTSTLTVNASPPAGGSPTGGGTYNCGTNTSVVANTNSGYSFVNWTATAGASNLTIFTPNSQTSNVMVNGTGTVTANFVLSNSAPTIGTVDLYTTGNSPTTAMSPQVEYNIKIPVTDNDTLNDLVTVKATLYYDSDGTYSEGEVPTSGNTQTCAILTWTKATNTLTIDSGGSSSWTVNNSSSVFPSLSGTSGTFEFHFKPGKVATSTAGAAKWHIYVKATDSVSNPGTGTKTDLTMNWYGEIDVIATTVDWDNIDAGLAFGEGDPSEEAVSVTYTCNGAYNQQVQSSTPWTGSPSGNATLNTGGSPGANEFSLKADDDGTLTDAITVTGSYQTFDTGTITSESGNAETSNSLWLSIGTPFTKATYSGTIYYQIAQ
jgi:hypothetical protein